MSGCARRMRAHEEGDADALRVLRGRIAVLDESAAAHIPSGCAARRAAAPAPAKARPARGAAAKSSCSRTTTSSSTTLSLDDDERAAPVDPERGRRRPG